MTLIAVLSSIPLSGPMGSLSSSFIPAGRLRNSPPGAALKKGHKPKKWRLRQWARTPFSLSLG